MGWKCGEGEGVETFPRLSRYSLSGYSAPSNTEEQLVSRSHVLAAPRHDQCTPIRNKFETLDPRTAMS